MTNLTGRTNGCAAAARGLARPRSGIGAVPENTPQRIACLGFRKQRAPRHRASMAEQADDAAGSTGGRCQPGKSKASGSPAAGGGRAGVVTRNLSGPKSLRMEH